MTDIKTAATIFGEVYRSAKGKNGSETLLKETQQEFFDAVTAYWETQTLAQMTTPWPHYHPEYLVVNDYQDNGITLYIMEEDPALKPWGGIIDGYVYRRGVTNKESYVDVERMQVDDPELWEDVSYWPQYDDIYSAMLWAFKAVKNPQPEKIAVEETEKYICEMDKTLLPSDDWTPKQAAKIQKYVVPGAVSPRLVPPRKAKEHELETGEIDE